MAAKELLEKGQDRKQQLEEEVWKEIEEHITSWEPERRRSCILKGEDLAIGTRHCYKKRRTWRMTSRRSRRKFKNWAGKKEKGYPGAGWNRKRTKAREVSQGERSLRGGPGCLKLPLHPGLFLVVRGGPVWISVDEDLHVI